MELIILIGEWDAAPACVGEETIIASGDKDREEAVSSEGG